MIDLFYIKDFLDTAARENLLAELRAARGSAATVYGKEAKGAVDSLVRKATRLNVSPETRGLVVRQLMERKAEIEEHFSVALSECEEPQFLRYQTGDYFVAHQDGNTPLIYDDTRFRKISIIIFLSIQSDEPVPDTYGGGEFLFHGPYYKPNLRLPAFAEPGTLAAFRAETTHEVTPLTHGERYTIASWYH